MKKIVLYVIYICISIYTFAQSTNTIALLKYNGGGDWYANPTSLTNLIKFSNKEIGTNFSPDYATVDIGSSELFFYPFIHLTGHGNIVFSDFEAKNLRTYLIGGGFLHIDDNYGIKNYVFREMKKVFPELDFIELPFSHPIYHQKFQFPNGLPKIHEHDNKAPQGFGLIYQGRLVCFFTEECDLGDGWEDTSVHNDTQEKHLQALRMGSNILQYVFIQ